MSELLVVVRGGDSLQLLRSLRGIFVRNDRSEASKKPLLSPNDFWRDRDPRPHSQQSAETVERKARGWPRNAGPEVLGLPRGETNSSGEQHIEQERQPA